jgi:hypothetical protein
MERIELCYEIHLSRLESGEIEALLTRERDFGQMSALDGVRFTQWADPYRVTQWALKVIYRDLCSDGALSPF